MFATKWAIPFQIPSSYKQGYKLHLTGVTPNIQFVRPFIKVKKLHLQLGNQATKFLGPVEQP